MTTKNKETKHYIHRKHNKQTHKPALANTEYYLLIQYDFHDLWLGNREGPIFTASEPMWSCSEVLATTL